MDARNNLNPQVQLEIPPQVNIEFEKQLLKKHIQNLSTCNARLPMILIVGGGLSALAFFGVILGRFVSAINQLYCLASFSGIFTSSFAGYLHTLSKKIVF